MEIVEETREVTEIKTVVLIIFRGMSILLKCGLMFMTQYRREWLPNQFGWGISLFGNTEQSDPNPAVLSHSGLGLTCRTTQMVACHSPTR